MALERKRVGLVDIMNLLYISIDFFKTKYCLLGMEYLSDNILHAVIDIFFNDSQENKALGSWKCGDSR